ncbi:MAG: methionyl-tRNA formyltransferase [Elusimicrobiota bacterium]|jgi:methionyl-tRNA formyltransferase|nr:methionyl-tRNA formyltransferase [Elusimicrobiota bacterium]
MLKTVFFGTPLTAVPFLEKLHSLSNVALVITQPDRPSGRGLSLKPSPIKQKALELGLPVISPENLNDAIAQILALKADFGLAVAYGKIFRSPMLEAFKYGIINIHFSLLPKYRGAAPVQYALFNGESQSGASAFWIDKGLDTGPLAAQAKTQILPQDNSITLFEKLINLGLQLVEETTKNIESGNIIKQPQIGEATLAPMIKKEETIVNFNTMTAEEINNKVRGLASGLPAYAKAKTINEETVQLLKTSVKHCPIPRDTAEPAKPGSIIFIERGLGFFVQCRQGILFIENIRPSAKGAMTAWDYYNGKKLALGAVIFS